MDTTSPQPGSLVLPAAVALPEAGQANEVRRDQLVASSSATKIPSTLIEELWLTAGAKACDLTIAEFRDTLTRVGEKFSFGQPSGIAPDAAQQADFLCSLRVGDLALATACALGRDAAWKRFLELYRASLTQAAVAITRSAMLGEELANSLYAELYGLRSSQADAMRRSPLASYSGRGSLLGWLRTTLAQRHVDHHRRTHRETPLEAIDPAAPEPALATPPESLVRLKHALVLTLQALAPENRFLLAAYFLDQRTLLEISRILHVHEATVSRKIKRLSQDLRAEILRQLGIGGLSARAAEEALGTDPRDLEINLRKLLQTSQSSPFSEKSNPKGPATGGAHPAEAGKP